MKIALAQINTRIGDFEGNLKIVLDSLKQAEKKGADLVVFPELTLTGYPPRDLLDRPDFIEANLSALKKLISKVGKTACLVGYVDRRASAYGKKLANAAAFIYQKKILARQHKTLLPTYDVFDEDRYFEAGQSHELVDFKGEKIGISICEDIWNDQDERGRTPYLIDPVLEQARVGASLLINLSASPFSKGRQKTRREMLQRQLRKYRAPLIYVNLVGGNDSLIFDGASMVFNKAGKLCRLLPSFCEALEIIDTRRLSIITLPKISEDEQVLDALVVGLRDYMKKCGFQKVVLGLSGGIDSALTAWIAVAALGARNVLGLSMPSNYSSPGSIKDAESLAKALGIEFRIHPIKNLYQDYLQALHFDRDTKIDVAMQNIQARIRGNLLMAVSNREGRLLLTTGNKSELAVGYCTLYGDMAGGLAVISDVPKTMVYRLAKLANRRKQAIPRATFTKPPSAELAPNQKDQDDLPPYEILDAILQAYLEEQQTPAEIVARGFAKQTVLDVIRRLDRNEYKRFQMPPGLRVTGKAFGEGRRVPITSGYRVG